MSQARNTRQKEAIRTAFLTADRPLSHDEAKELAQQQVEGLSIATVYRNVNLLLEELWLTRVEVPGDAPRYEISGKAHHHHFRCNCCKRLYELPGCSVQLGAALPPGFETTGHELFLFGTCSACASERAIPIQLRRDG